MEVADEIASNIGYTKSDVVIRQGENVSFNKVDKDSIPDYIINRIEDYKSKGYKTIGIISKTDLLSSYLNDDLYFFRLSRYCLIFRQSFSFVHQEAFAIHLCLVQDVF